MFPSKKGNGTYVGSIKPTSFEQLFNIMQEAHGKGVDLMFIASPDKQNQGRVTLYVAPSNRPSNTGGSLQGAFGGAPQPTQQSFAPPVPQQAPVASGPFNAAPSVNPPKDELDQLLESL